jgi:hypothetical protein
MFAFHPNHTMTATTRTTSAPGNSIASPNADQRSPAVASASLTARHAPYAAAPSTPSKMPAAASVMSLPRPDLPAIRLI